MRQPLPFSRELFYDYRVTGSPDRDGLDATDSAGRLGGRVAVPAYGLAFDGRRLSLVAVPIATGPRLVDQLAGVAWLRVELYVDSAAGPSRQYTFVAHGVARATLELTNDAATGDPVSVLDGVAWADAEPVEVVDLPRKG